MTRSLFPAVLAILAFGSPNAFAQSQATYTVTFIATWSSATHPDQFPSNPHFSGLVGAVHNDGIQFWSEGSLASPGMEAMAETGAKGLLLAEAQLAVVNRFALSELSGSGISVSPGSVSLTVVLSYAFPLITLVSMMAPSPDWFVGVANYALRGEAGWDAFRDVPLMVYDAGTDDGPAYTSPNQDSAPHQAITALVHPPFASSSLVGRFQFRLQSVTSVEQPHGSPDLFVYPNPAGPSSITVDLPFRAESVQVFDMLGRLTYDAFANGDRLVIPEGALLAGSYIVRAGRHTRLLTVTR